MRFAHLPVFAQTPYAELFSNIHALERNISFARLVGALHKLIVRGERPLRDCTKATKDLLQAASLASDFIQTNQAEVFNTAWQGAR